MEAVGAVDCAYTGAGITVAVLDTGIDANWKNHLAFAGMDIVTKNFTTDPDADLIGHGTHCAATIFGRTTDGCRIGVAPGIQRALIGKVLGAHGSSTASIVKAILWAIQNDAHIISMSLGIDFTGYQEHLSKRLPQRLATSMALAGYGANVRLFDRLSQLTSARMNAMRGAVVVAAAGNESQRDVDPHYRITTAPPAAAEHFVSVAALGRNHGGKAPSYHVAPFSNTGARVAAPGVDITSAKPGGGLATMSGTSMATPHVAGVAALWAEKLIRRGNRFQAKRVLDHMERAVMELPGIDAEDVDLGLVRAPADT